MSTIAPKLKPFADAIRARIRELQPLGVAVFRFAAGEWEPTSRFWTYTGKSMGFVLSVRRHREATFVFRIE